MLTLLRLLRIINASLTRIETINSCIHEGKLGVD